MHRAGWTIVLGVLLGGVAACTTTTPSADATGVGDTDVAGSAAGPAEVSGGDAAASGDAGASADTPHQVDAPSREADGDAGPQPRFDAVDGGDTIVPDGGSDDGIDGVGLWTTQVETPSGRVLPVAVWYPARVPPDAEGERYLGLLAGQAVRDAPARAGGPWPLVVFSHGNQSLKEQSIFLTEFLAAQGYVVAAPDHVGNTFLTYDESQLVTIARERPADLSAVIDRFEAPEPEDPAWVHDRVDTEHIAAIGHSFGGYTVLALGGAPVGTPEIAVAYCEDHPDEAGCAEVLADPDAVDALGDPRVDVIVPMAPAGYVAFGAEGLAQVWAVSLVMVALDDTLTPYATEAKPIFEALPPPRYLWTVAAGGHFVFSDFCTVAAELPPGAVGEMGDACSPDLPITPDVSHVLIDEVVLALLDAYLKGDAEARARLDAGEAGTDNPHVQFEAVP